MKRLPGIKGLASGLNQRKSTKNSVNYLVANADSLSTYGSIDGLSIGFSNGEKQAKGMAHHLTNLRFELGRELWTRRFFVSPDVIDEVLYHVIASERSEDPLLRSLEIIRDNRIARPGVIIFPVHSFGVLGGGFMRFGRERAWRFNPPASELAIFPQSNQWKRTLDNIGDACRIFEVRKAVPVELMDHWRKSRSLRWLERNPLMAIRARTAPGSYYDTEFFVVGRLKSASTLACMLSTLQPINDDRGFRLISSSRMNNWETLDIHHYINLFDSPSSRRTLTGDCVPINSRQAELADVSELNIEVDPRYWSRNGGGAARVRAAVDAVYDGHMRHVILRRTKQEDGKFHAFKKLHDSQTYFRRSFHVSEEGWSSIISLATAFEMMLTDGTSSGKVADRLKERVRLLLRGTKGVLNYADSVHSLYKARNFVVHAGMVPGGVDLDTARKAYVRCFIKMAERVDTLNPRSTSPMRDICGDN
ncbi:hypothetical protein ABZ498_19440 [Streptomyces lavendulocolor]|uniref:hypothetical protein n=1 Tax=Streptomyces lavendulocolor TaxID=67316 RepID=UPI0033C744CE